ncbi:MAG: hypothetical protein SFX18_05530 [Pirellulales bacterium]|nr:hypothetical protein [Pirellulales bacterium]
MPLLHWLAWSGYVVLFACMAGGLTLASFYLRPANHRALLTAWVSLLTGAVFLALRISQWLVAELLPTMIALGIVALVLLSAGVNAAYEQGRRSASDDAPKV